jgi:hypothetical protein
LADNQLHAYAELATEYGMRVEIKSI